MQYVDSEGFVWEGAAINCLDCAYLDTLKKSSRCNNYKDGAHYRYCSQYHLCENEIRERFGVGVSDRIECSAWRPGN